MPLERSPLPAETASRYSLEGQNDMEIDELRRAMAEQQRTIERLQHQQQQQQQQQQTANNTTNQGVTYLTEGNFAHFSIRDALEAVPTFDGENISFVYFVEGCEEALSMIAPAQENILVRAVRNKLKGDAHRSILGRTFNNMREIVEFLRAKYGPRETVYEAQGRLAYLCQKKDEKVSAYANRVRELGKRIIDAQRRETGVISHEFRNSIEEHLKTSFLRGLNKELIISREGTFEEIESRAIDAEKEIETINMIRRVVLAENTTEKRAPTRRVTAEEIICQLCHRKGHTADRCRGFPRNLGNNYKRDNYQRSNYQTNDYQRNLDRTYYNSPRKPQNFFPRNPSMNPQNPSNTGSYQRNTNFNQTSNQPANFNQPLNFNQFTNSGNRLNQINQNINCRYCKKPGHIIEECRKRMYNNNNNNDNSNTNYNNQQFVKNQGNRQIPERNGATSGRNNMRPTRAISIQNNSEMNSEE